MERNTKKNKKIHKNVGLFKSAIESEVIKEIQAFEGRLKRTATDKEKARIRHNVTHSFKTRLAVRVGSLALVGALSFSAGAMLNEGSGRIEGVTQENEESVTVDSKNFRDGIKVVGLGDDGILVVQDGNGQDVQVTNENIQDIKEQNDINAQREAQINQIKEDIKNIKNKEDTLEYMKKFYKEQYNQATGKQLITISIEFYSTTKEIVVKDASGTIIDSWSPTEKNEGVLAENYNAINKIEELRIGYRNADGKNIEQFLSKDGGLKEQVVDSIIEAKGLNEEQTKQMEDSER